MAVYAVIDTNVLISALLSSKEDSATVQVIEKLIAGAITPLYSQEIINEYREVLNRSKFKFSQYKINFLLSAIEKFGILVNPASTDFSLPDIKDLPFYEVVMEKKDDGAYLVTGNLRHFPQKPFVVTPRQLIEILESVR